MLEWGSVLRTYRLNKAPKDAAEWPAEAVRIADHPLRFLSYQGPVNEGRGNVQIADSGTYEIISDEENRLELILNGEILNGRFELVEGKKKSIFKRITE